VQDADAVPALEQFRLSPGKRLRPGRINFLLEYWGMNAPEPKSLPDVQATPDPRDIAINRVGIKSLRHPVRIAAAQGAVSTVASIVKAHGGFITVRSALGEGTELAVYLPALPPGSQLPAPKGIKVRLMENECFINPGRAASAAPAAPPDGNVIPASSERDGIRLASSASVGESAIHAGQPAILTLARTEAGPVC